MSIQGQVWSIFDLFMYVFEHTVSSGKKTPVAAVKVKPGQQRLMQPHCLNNLLEWSIKPQMKVQQRRINQNSFNFLLYFILVTALSNILHRVHNFLLSSSPVSNMISIWINKVSLINNSLVRILILIPITQEREAQQTLAGLITAAGRRI